MVRNPKRSVFFQTHGTHGHGLTALGRRHGRHDDDSMQRGGRGVPGVPVDGGGEGHVAGGLDLFDRSPSGSIDVKRHGRKRWMSWPRAGAEMLVWGATRSPSRTKAGLSKQSFVWPTGTEPWYLMCTENRRHTNTPSRDQGLRVFSLCSSTSSGPGRPRGHLRSISDPTDGSTSPTLDPSAREGATASVESGGTVTARRGTVRGRPRPWPRPPKRGSTCVGNAGLVFSGKVMVTWVYLRSSTPESAPGWVDCRLVYFPNLPGRVEVGGGPI